MGGGEVRHPFESEHTCPQTAAWYTYICISNLELHTWARRLTINSSRLQTCPVYEFCFLLPHAHLLPYGFALRPSRICEKRRPHMCETVSPDVSSALGVRETRARAGRAGGGALAAGRDPARLGCHLDHTTTLPHLVAVRSE